jgi:single-strand DNA-binding protein
MSSVNKVHLLGHAGRDCEMRYMPNGKAVANVSIATSSVRKVDGERVEDTQWHRVVLYERLAEVAGEFIKKGKQVYVEGRLKYGKYTDKDGVEKNTCDIVATELQLLGGRGEESEQRQAERPNAYAEARGRSPAPARQSSGFDDMDDDTPF